MRRSQEQLRTDALAIWRAGLDAVDSRQLVERNVRALGGELIVGSERFQLGAIDCIVVVGAGKAGAGMAAGIEAALGEPLMREKQLAGWVNVPDDCVVPLAHITLHATRPPGINEPTPAAVSGTQKILELVGLLGERDLCICLLSGGGSALLVAPAEGITLEDKLAVTRHLSAAGADIGQLNTVRRQLSRVKAGGLARACTAGVLVSLIISDVLGDPLDTIASGPTVVDSSDVHEVHTVHSVHPGNGAAAQQALEVLERFKARESGVPERVFEFLERRVKESPGSARETVPRRARVVNSIIGNNALAVAAAVDEARRRGYTPRLVAETQLEGDANELGRELAESAVRMRREPGPDCLIWGGEPTVRLVPPEQRGMGGRNQQLVLAAFDHLREAQSHTSAEPQKPLAGIVLLSSGTDGEDGPTDAAGAFVDQLVADAARQLSLSPDDYLRRNDAYHFFQPLDALIKTGPTHTNVCDVRVALVDRIENAGPGD